MSQYDVIVVGAGPSAAFLAYEMLQIDKTKIISVHSGRGFDNEL